VRPAVLTAREKAFSSEATRHNDHRHPPAYVQGVRVMLLEWCSPDVSAAHSAVVGDGDGAAEVDVE